MCVLLSVQCPRSGPSGLTGTWRSWWSAKAVRNTSIYFASKCSIITWQHTVHNNITSVVHVALPAILKMYLRYTADLNFQCCQAINVSLFEELPWKFKWMLLTGLLLFIMEWSNYYNNGMVQGWAKRPSSKICLPATLGTLIWRWPCHRHQPVVRWDDSIPLFTKYIRCRNLPTYCPEIEAVRLDLRTCSSINFIIKYISEITQEQFFSKFHHKWTMCRTHRSCVSRSPSDVWLLTFHPVGGFEITIAIAADPWIASLHCACRSFSIRRWSLQPQSKPSTSIWSYNNILSQFETHEEHKL